MHVKKNETSNSWEVFIYVEDYTGKKKLKHIKDIIQFSKIKILFV